MPRDLPDALIAFTRERNDSADGTLAAGDCNSSEAGPANPRSSRGRNGNEPHHRRGDDRRSGGRNSVHIIIGGIAGWLAEQFMKSDTGLLMNIVLGIAGAAIASAIFSFFGIALGGWIGYLIVGFIGACLLIWIVRAVRGRTA
jgi:uncharacterized membrane protein YeaQ/YmgE (transglycosylase-associated protein family)